MVFENCTQISMHCQVLCKGQPQMILLAFLCNSVHLGCDWELLLWSVLTLFPVAALTCGKGSLRTLGSCDCNAP